MTAVLNRCWSWLLRVSREAPGAWMMTPDDPEVQKSYWRRVANSPGRTVCFAFDDVGRIVACELPYGHPGSHLVRLERNAYRGNDHRGSDNRIIDWPPRTEDLDSAREESEIPGCTSLRPPKATSRSSGGCQSQGLS